MSVALSLQTLGHLSPQAPSAMVPLSLMTEGYLWTEASAPTYVGPEPSAQQQYSRGGWGGARPWTTPPVIEEGIFYREDAPIHASVETALLLSGDNIFDRIAAMIGEELHVRKNK